MVMTSKRMMMIFNGCDVDQDKNDDDVYPGEWQGEIGTGYISALTLNSLH